MSVVSMRSLAEILGAHGFRALDSEVARLMVSSATRIKVCLPSLFEMEPRCGGPLSECTLRGGWHGLCGTGIDPEVCARVVGAKQPVSLPTS